MANQQTMLTDRQLMDELTNRGWIIYGAVSPKEIEAEIKEYNGLNECSVEGTDEFYQTIADKINDDLGGANWEKIIQDELLENYFPENYPMSGGYGKPDYE